MKRREAPHAGTLLAFKIEPANEKTTKNLKRSSGEKYMLQGEGVPIILMYCIVEMMLVKQTSFSLWTNGNVEGEALLVRH